MKICLVIAGDAEKRTNICSLVEDLGLIVLEAANGDSAFISAQALSPDVIVFDWGTLTTCDSGLVEQLKVLRNGKEPFIMSTDEPDIEVLAASFIQQNLIHESMRRAMGV